MRKCELNLCIHMTSKRKLILVLHSVSISDYESKLLAPQEIKISSKLKMS